MLKFEISTRLDSWVCKNDFGIIWVSAIFIGVLTQVSRVLDSILGYPRSHKLRILGCRVTTRKETASLTYSYGENTVISQEPLRVM